MSVLRVHAWRRAGNWWMRCLKGCLGRSVRGRSEMAHQVCPQGWGVLSARNLQTPSEAPSKPYKACRRCSKGSYSAVVEEIGKAVS